MTHQLTHCLLTAISAVSSSVRAIKNMLHFPLTCTTYIRHIIFASKHSGLCLCGRVTSVSTAARTDRPATKWCLLMFNRSGSENIYCTYVLALSLSLLHTHTLSLLWCPALVWPSAGMWSEAGNVWAMKACVYAGCSRPPSARGKTDTIPTPFMPHLLFFSPSHSSPLSPPPPLCKLFSQIPFSPLLLQDSITQFVLLSQFVPFMHYSFSLTGISPVFYHWKVSC